MVVARRSRRGTVRPVGARRRAVAGCAAALVLAGCAAAAAPAQPVATDRCSAPELPTLQAGLHLIGDREPPVPYSSVPPTSGWHRSGPAQPGVSDEPLTEPQQVGLLESGRVVVSHGPLDGQASAALAELAAAYPESVAVAPYSPLQEGEVVAAAWGVLQRCDGIDGDALRRFVDFYADREALEGAHGSS